MVSKRSIQRYRRRGPAHPSSQTRRTFLANHAHHVWAADLLTVQALTFKTLYVLVFIASGRRELVHVNVTAHPTAAWVWRQVIEATPWGRKPRHLLRDRDAVYGRDFRQRARRIGIDSVATPVASPRANAVAERFIGTLRRECLDHLIVLDEQHLRSVLGEFVQVLQPAQAAPDTAPRDAGPGMSADGGAGAIRASARRRAASRSLTSAPAARALTQPHGCRLSAGEKCMARFHLFPRSRQPSLGELLGSSQAQRQVWRKHKLRIVQDAMPPLRSAERQAERRTSSPLIAASASRGSSPTLAM